jgi:hypothetical protein
MSSSLKDYCHAEIPGGREKPFSGRRVIQRAMRSKGGNFIFWFSSAYVWHQKQSRILRSMAKRINIRPEA